VPPRGVWGRTARVTSTTAESWLGRPLDTDPSIDEVVLRSIAAFGPATVAEVSTWSRLTGLREVVERLRPGLRTFRATAAVSSSTSLTHPGPIPTRRPRRASSPEYDNLLLSHADRSRVVSGENRGRLSTVKEPVHGSVLHDGFVCGVWRLDRDREKAVLVISLVDRLTKRSTAAVTAEGGRLLRFLAADADAHDVSRRRRRLTSTVRTRS